MYTYKTLKQVLEENFKTKDYNRGSIIDFQSIIPNPKTIVSYDPNKQGTITLPVSTIGGLKFFFTPNIDKFKYRIFTKEGREEHFKISLRSFDKDCTISYNNTGFVVETKIEYDEIKNFTSVSKIERL